MRPLNRALPAVAAAPQQNVAVAMKKYPRQGCDCCSLGRGLICSSAALLGKQLVQSVRIEPDHDVVVDDDGGGGTALVCADKLKDGLLVHADVFHLKCDPFLRKVGLGPGAWRSTGRDINHYSLGGHPSSPNRRYRFLKQTWSFIFSRAAARFPWLFPPQPGEFPS
jgi:hypothetical protein